MNIHLEVLVNSLSHSCLTSIVGCFHRRGTYIWSAPCPANFPLGWWDLSYVYYRISSWIMPTAKFCCECKLPCRVHYPPLATFTTNSATLCLGWNKLNLIKTIEKYILLPLGWGTSILEQDGNVQCRGKAPIFRPCPLLKTPPFLSGHVQIIMSLFKEDYILSTYIFKIKYLQWFFSQNVV